MTIKVEALLEEAKQLSPLEQLDLIRGLSESLQESYRDAEIQVGTVEDNAIPSTVRRTTPARNLEDYAADFWPEDESVEEFNNFVRKQRQR